jgi:hypothetical protein
MRLANDFINYTITSVTSASTVHVSANVKLYKQTSRTWRSTTTAQQVWVIDMLSIRTAPLPILVYYTNFTQMVIKANTTNSFTSPPYDSGTLILKKDPEHQIYKHIQYITVDFRYIQITIPSQTPTDGAGYYHIGTIAVPSSYKSLTKSGEQFEWAFNKQVDLHEVDVEAEGGVIDSVLISGIPEMEFSLQGKMTRDFETADKLGGILGVPDKGYVLIDLERNGYEVYLSKRSATYQREEDRRIATHSYTFRTV